MGTGGGWVGEIGLAPDMLPWSCLCMSAFSFGYQQTHAVSKCKCVSASECDRQIQRIRMRLQYIPALS